MSVLRFATLDLHKLVKFQDTSLTAGITLTALVKNGYARMEDTLFVVSRLTII